MSLRGWIFLCSALSLLALPSVHLAQLDTGAGGMADPRAAVAVRLVIDAENCKERLRGELPRVEQEIFRSLNRSLEQFGFLILDPSAEDTITFKLVQRQTRPRHVLLEVSAAGPGVEALEPVSIVFEKFGQRQDWSPDVVSREWSRELDNILRRHRDDLVSNVLGLPPLHANVTLHVERESQILQAHVRVRPAMIGAAQDPRFPKPKFRVRVIVRDLHAPLPTEGVAELILGGCLLHMVEKTYVCEVEAVVYQGKSSPVSERWVLLERAVMVTTSVHVFEYWPRARPRGQGAIMVSRRSQRP
ncbi:MAG: hypothetical protein IH977_11930 [Nitrospinae bacterium]|nr:hypothetical protein [Nitrospinota bacterium]